MHTFVRTAEACGFWDDVLLTTFSDFGRRLEENSRKGTDHGWGSYSFVFGKNLRRQVLGFNADVNSSALQHIVPFQADAYDPAKNTKGDLLMTTDIETWNACLLNALALPALPRLGSCPPEMQLRDGLAEVPLFDERLYYKTATGSGSTGGGGSSGGTPSIPGDGDTSHLTAPMTPSQVLHFARRVGYSSKSLGLAQFVLPNMAAVIEQDFLRCGDTEGVVLVVNPDSSRRNYSAGTTHTGSMLNQTSHGGAHIAAAPFDDLWLELDLGKPMLVHGFITQARGASWCATEDRGFSCNSHVMTARIEYRLQADDAPTALPEIFNCNVVGDIWETVTNRFSAPVMARFVRIRPVTWHRVPTMRAGLLASCVTPQGMTEHQHPIFTLQQGISRALDAATQPIERPEKIYSKYQKRERHAMALWSQERREKRNNWRDLTRLPYPRYDPVERRVRRYGIEEYFDWDTFVFDTENPVASTLHVKDSHRGREDEILEKLQANCTIFFYPLPVSFAKGDFDWMLLDNSVPPRLIDATQVDWYRTVMQSSDVRLVTQVTPQMIVDDYKCDNATGTHPDDPSIPCDPACDLRKHLTIDYVAQTAMLTDTSRSGPDGTHFTASWYILKQCVRPDEARDTFEINRHNLLNLYIQKDIAEQFFQDATNPENGLRSRMTWFFLNLYATPQSIVNDALLMYRQYEALYSGALGNYRSLSRARALSLLLSLPSLSFSLCLSVSLLSLFSLVTRIGLC